MKVSSLLGAGLIGLAAYLLLELVFGSTGLIAHRYLAEYQELATRELAALEVRSAELQREINMLTGDAERVRVEARSIGLYGEDDTLVRIGGAYGAPRRYYLPGEVASRGPKFADQRPLFRGIALVFALVVMIVDLLAGQKNVGGNARRQRAGERVTRDWDIEVDP